MIKSKRYSYIDILNIIATFSVLALHTSQAFFWTPKTSSIHQQTAVMQIVFIPAVLLFFMISGAMLVEYKKKQSTKVFLQHRLKRVGMPFFIWSVLWYLYDIFWPAYPGPIRHLNPSLIDFIRGLVMNNINNTFWFFYVIISLYLVTPLFSQLAISGKTNLLFGIVCVYFLFNCVLNYAVGIFHLDISLNQISQPLLTSSYIGYFIIGYLIHKNYFSRRNENLFILCGSISLILAVILSFSNPGLKTTSTTGLLVFLYSVALFIIIKRWGSRIILNDKQTLILAKIASTNLGVYLVHPFFIKAFDKVFVLKQTSWIHVYLFPFIIYGFSIVVIFICKKIPIVKSIFP
ncbi:acyltransferase [Loigolactobacillus coryniformis subsp. coryniformis]|uniref:acyltransferase n=1 Tax=Loigolactobacillus coryniformis TaxID=1610 RepID=UPI003996683C